MNIKFSYTSLFLILPLILITFLIACNKKSSSNSDSKDYNVEGFHDITLYSNSTILMPLGVTATSTNQGQVSFSIIDLPTGVTYKFEPNSGTPSFSTLLTITSTNKLQSGTFPIKLIVTSSTLGNKTLNANIIIPNDCRNNIVGLYSGKNYSSDGSVNSITDSIYTYGTKDTIMMSSAGGQSFFNCSTGEITGSYFSSPDGSISSSSYGNFIRDTIKLLISRRYKSDYYVDSIVLIKK